MSKLKIKARGISMEVVGKDDLIQREREAFLDYAENHSGIKIGVTAIQVEGLKPFPEHMNCKCSCDSEDSTEETEDKQEGGIDYIRTVKRHHKMNWQELAEKIKKGIIPVEVGATVSCELTDGTPAEFVVTDVTDRYVRFETRNFIGGEVEWNEQDTNKGGYPDSDIRGYIDSTIWGLLPEDLQAVISSMSASLCVIAGQVPCVALLIVNAVLFKNLMKPPHQTAVCVTIYHVVHRPLKAHA